VGTPPYNPGWLSIVFDKQETIVNLDKKAQRTAAPTTSRTGPEQLGRAPEGNNRDLMLIFNNQAITASTMLD